MSLNEYMILKRVRGMPVVLVGVRVEILLMGEQGGTSSGQSRCRLLFLRPCEAVYVGLSWGECLRGQHACFI